MYVCAPAYAFILNFPTQKEVPFAVVGSREEVEVGGKRSRVRKYPWGMVEGEREKSRLLVLSAKHSFKFFNAKIFWPF